MEVSYTVNIYKKKGLLRSTERAFLGRLCEEIAARYLAIEKKWHILARNVRFRFGEVDLIAEDTSSRTRWIVEVRGRKASSYKAALWLSNSKVRRLRMLANVMAAKARSSYRILFLQIEILESKRTGEIRAFIEEFEIQASD